MKHVVSFSGGAGSAAAAKRVAAQHGTADLTLLFTDTIIEDNDLYRFVVEGAADVSGVQLADVAPLAARALALPEVWEDEARRKADLAALRADALRALPVLRWLADGRTPWDVFFDERFLGNSAKDPCSKILKRRVADRWVRDNCDPAATLCYVGIDWTEEHRFEGDPEPPPGVPRPKKWSAGLRRRMAAKGWTYRAPLCEPPLIVKPDVLAWMESIGLRRPRLYTEGFGHNNCLGGCVKAGQAQWAMVLDLKPAFYAWNEAKEEAIRAYLGANVSILRDRRGGGSRPLRRLVRVALRRNAAAPRRRPPPDVPADGVGRMRHTLTVGASFTAAHITEGREEHEHEYALVVSMDAEGRDAEAEGAALNDVSLELHTSRLNDSIGSPWTEALADWIAERVPHAVEVLVEVDGGPREGGFAVRRAA